MSQREALDVAVAALRASGALGPSDDAEVAAAEALADIVDRHPVFNADLWREYRLALRALRAARPDDSGDDDLAAVIEALRGAAPMEHAPNRSSDPRR